jgi:thymidylate synthase
MNNLDRQYQSLLQEILDNGVTKSDRTGTGTKSIFSAQIKHDMEEGFPLLSTKRIAFRLVVTELLWFLRGETNIEWLVENGNNIWVGDAYKNYCKIAGSVEEPDYDIHVDDPNQNCTRLMTQEEFVERIKTNSKFAKKWGELGPIYGAQWRNWDIGKTKPVAWEHGAPTVCAVDGIDQIQQAIDTLRTNPDSRRIIVSAWKVDSLENMVLPPCHWAFELYTEELTDVERVELYKQKIGQSELLLPLTPQHLDTQEIPKRRLSLKWHQRSVDTFLGLPFNVASYGLLLSIIAKEVNMIPGMLVGDLTNVHLYNNHIDQALEQINREPKTLPELVFKDPFWDICDEEGNINDKINRYEPEWFTVEDYMPHPTIKAPLSN